MVRSSLAHLLSQLHPYCQQRPIVAYCREHGIVIQAYAPLIRGQFDDPILMRLSEKVKSKFTNVCETDTNVSLSAAQARSGAHSPPMVPAAWVGPLRPRDAIFTEFLSG